MRMSRRMGLLGGGGPLWLFDGTKGGDVTKNTGGWERVFNPDGHYTSSAEVREDCLYFSHKRNDSKSNTVSLTTVNLIDFSKVSTLYCNAYRNTQSDYGRVVLYLVNASGNNVAQVQLNKQTAAIVTSLDCSKVTEPCRVRLTGSGTKNVVAAISNYVTQIWGE